MKNYKDVAYKLKMRFEELDMNIRSLSNKLDISEPTLRNYLNGNREPNIATLIQLCSILNLNVSSLFSVPEGHKEYELTDIEVKMISLLRKNKLSIEKQKQLLSIIENILQYDRKK